MQLEDSRRELHGRGDAVRQKQIAVGLAFALLFSLIISVTVYFLLSRTVTRPVRRLVSSMQNFEMQAETYKYKADKANVVEFSTLSASFEHMVQMIQSLMKRCIMRR